MVGRTVSHYQIVERLGKGGMGDIYKALDPRLNRFVAIKVLPASMSSDPARRRRFVQEAQAASGLNHPNIITIYDVVLEQETEFMLMEYVAGKTLLDLIPNGGLRVPQVLNYGVQMADALTAAHAAGIVHRDLKPGNIMVTDAGLVKVLDFGLAKLEPAVNMGDESETVVAATLTVEGSILGTVNYMSPEQAQGFRVDARSDIFSFGVLLYEMLTGLRPFTGESPISTMSSILRDEAKPLGEITPGIPVRLQELVSRCLRKNPDDRWQSMQDVRAVLVALKQESDSGQSSATEVAAVKPLLATEPRRGSKAALLVVALLVVGVAAVWWFTRHAAPAAPTVVVMAPTPQAMPDRPSPFAPAQPPPAASKPPDTQTPVPDSQPPAAEPVKPAAHAAITLVDGSPLSLILTDDIPANAPAGTLLHFTVSREVEVAGVVAIRKGAVVQGEIAQEAKKRLLVFGPKMMMRLTTLQAADDHTLRVRATPVHRLEALMARPVDVGGKAKPKGIAAVAGTEYVGYIDGDQSLGPAK